MGKETPLVSIIIPAYNRAGFLKEAIKSVLAQTYKNIEVIVVDDGSTDNTPKLVKQFTDKRIIYLRQENKGASSARNKGIESARGNYIAFLDSDDIWLPQKIEKQLEIFNISRCNPGLVYTGIQYMDYDGNLKKQKKIIRFRGDILKRLLRKNIPGVGSTMLIKKECFEKCGLFDERLPSRTDLDMVIRISEHFTVDYVPEILALERIHEGRITADIEKKIKGREILFGKIEPHLKKHRVLLAKYLHETGKLYFENGDMDKVREYLNRSFRVFPLWRSAIRLLVLKIKNKP